VRGRRAGVPGEIEMRGWGKRRRRWEREGRCRGCAKVCWKSLPGVSGGEEVSAGKSRRKEAEVEEEGEVGVAQVVGGKSVDAC
jgi:hypothetical protein